MFAGEMTHEQWMQQQYLRELRAVMQALEETARKALLIVHCRAGREIVREAMLQVRRGRHQLRELEDSIDRINQKPTVVRCSAWDNDDEDE